MTTTTLVRADVLLACCIRTLTLRVPADEACLERIAAACRLHVRYCPSAL